MHYLPLLYKMVNGEISSEEMAELRQWLDGLPMEEYARVFDEYQLLLTDHPREDLLPPFQEQWLHRAKARMESEDQEILQYHHKVRLRTLLVRLSAAALLTAIAGWWWIHIAHSKVHQSIGNTGRQELALIPPGSNGAILTLSDGRTVVLDSLANGRVAAEKGALVTLQDSRLDYTTTPGNEGPLEYNTVTTPKGRQFRLTLADGSKVWLNAASSIRFPAAFTGRERKVRLSGEAYLEVAPATDKPFLVEADGNTAIHVLGTSFNVQAYDGAGASTVTLLEGKIRVTPLGPDSARTVLLKPGQQVLSANGSLRVQQVDTEPVLAWKNGLFNFENASVKEVMQQLERWYDVEVVYPNGIPNLHFMGYMSRDLPLQEVLKGLQGAELHVTIEQGRKLIVLP